jgi:excisionase family DNA binding protein
MRRAHIYVYCTDYRLFYQGKVCHFNYSACLLCCLTFVSSKSSSVQMHGRAAEVGPRSTTLSAEQVARLFGVTSSTVYVWTRLGVLKNLASGRGSYAYDVVTVHALLRRCGGDPHVRLLRAAEVAMAFGVEPCTVRRWVRENKLPAVRLPGGRHRPDCR